MAKKKFTTKWTVIAHHDNGTEKSYRFECDGTPTNDMLRRSMDRYDRLDVRSLRIENELGRTVMMRYGRAWDAFGIRHKDTKA